MNTRVVGPSRVVAAASAAVITAVSAWAFVSASAVEPDPFHFASIMHANAEVRVAQAQSRTVSTCPNNPEAQDHRAPACLRG